MRSAVSEITYVTYTKDGGKISKFINIDVGVTVLVSWRLSHKVSCCKFS